jgi:ferredoxin--NADP+ reductase
MTLGTESNPLRVAIFGAGPAGFYAADYFLKLTNIVVEVDMYDRLPTPFGLVRGGVAPDHQKIKSVTAAYDKVAAKPRFRFFGNVEYGKHIKLDDLKQHYHQVLFSTGAQTDRRMGIPGEDLKNSHPATEFVAWYNGHPDYRDLNFDLSVERVAVVGVGNVAIDVARILCLTPAELAKTDIADQAYEALSKSKIKEVYLLGRRGPVQAAFTLPEIKEVGEMEDADAITLPDEVVIDELSKVELEKSERDNQRKVEVIQSYAGKQPTKNRKLFVRFLVSPTELSGEGKVSKMKLVKNKLVGDDKGNISAKATDKTEELNVGLVFRSVGYRGVALPEIPFNDKGGTILNEKGRVVDANKQQVVGLYAAGWIKRGPSGVIGTNKPDSVETATLMIEDAQKGTTWTPAKADKDSVEALVKSRQPNYFSYPDWQKLDKMEVEKGKALGKPRVKFTSVDEMVKAVGK